LNERKTSNNSDGNILILGIGNVLMGDEGIGALVAQYLLNKKIPDGINCVDGGTGGFHLLEYLQNASKVYLIDATNDGKPVGTISHITPRFSSDYPKTLTAHDIGLKDLIDSFYLLGKVPDIKLYAVSIDPPGEPTMELSGIVKEKIPYIAKMVLDDAIAGLAG